MRSVPVSVLVLAAVASFVAGQAAFTMMVLINFNLIVLITFAIGSGLAAFAGVVIIFIGQAQADLAAAGGRNAQLGASAQRAQLLARHDLVGVIANESSQLVRRIIYYRNIQMPRSKIWKDV